MSADCPGCGADDAVHYPDGCNAATATYCECEDCGARFEIDADADYDREAWHDCSTPGKRIDPHDDGDAEKLRMERNAAEAEVDRR